MRGEGMTLRVLDLFSGIGGFSLGLERAGMRTVAFCEIDPYCRAVLRKHWPGVPVHDDIRTLRGIPSELVCGGFPCQDTSRAGRRAGIEGERSGLWRHQIRVLEESEAPWFVAENPHQAWRTWVPVLRGALHELGYASVPLRMRAREVGLCHRRARVLLVAHANRQHLQQQRGRRGGPCREDSLLLARLGESWRAHRAPAGVAFPAVDRAGDGLPDRVDRNRVLGNAVVPAIAELAGRLIIDVEQCMNKQMLTHNDKG
jgi:DNA (cytosine-5)-methyltransferase 1